MVERLTVLSSLRSIAGERRSHGLLGRVAWETAGTVALNAGGIVLQFALALALTRLLGAEGYGAYTFALAWALVLASPAMLGMTPLVVRNVAAYSAQGSWGLARGMILRSHQVVAATSVAVAGVAALIGWFVADGESDALGPFLIALVLVPLISLTAMRQAAMQGLGHVVLGRTPEVIVLPGLLLVLLSIVFLGTADDLSPSAAVALNVTSAVVAVALGGWLLRRSLTREAARTPPSHETRGWAVSALPFIVASLAIALNGQIGTIVVGAVSGASETGVFNAALRLALLVGFLSLAATYSLQPLAARLFAQGELRELERVLARAGRALLVAATIVSVVLFVFAEPVLELFGEEFRAGASALRILVVGELLRLTAGYSNLALVMTKHERAATVAFCVGTGVNVALTAVLAQAWGAEGAALGLAASGVVWGALAVYFVWRRLDIVVAGILPHRR